MRENSRLPRLILEEWVRELVKNPLKPFDAGPVLNPGDPHQDPELALELDGAGIPVWWPRRHPETLRRLSRRQRRSWFLEWLRDRLGGEPLTRVLTDVAYRRQRIAIELVTLQGEGDLTGFADFPYYR